MGVGVEWEVLRLTGDRCREERWVSVGSRSKEPGKV